MGRKPHPLLIFFLFLQLSIGLASTEIQQLGVRKNERVYFGIHPSQKVQTISSRNFTQNVDQGYSAKMVLFPVPLIFPLNPLFQANEIFLSNGILKIQNPDERLLFIGPAVNNGV